MNLFVTILCGVLGIIGFLSYGLFYYFADKKDNQNNKKK